MTQSPERERVHCNKCRILTWHDVLHMDHVDEDLIGDNSLVWRDTNSLLKCRGCDTVQLKVESGFLEFDPDTGRRETTGEFYPAHISRHKPQWLSQLGGPFWR